MITRNQIVSLLWASIFSIGCWIALHSTQIRTELTLLMPTGSGVTQQLLINHMREGTTSRLILLGLTGAHQDILAQASQRLANELRKSQSFSSVHNGDIKYFQKDSNLLFKYRYLLSPQLTAEQFHESQLHTALRNRLRDVSSIMPPFMKNRATSDITGEFLKILKRSTSSNTPHRHNGVWFSSNGDVALLTAETTASGFDLDAQEQIQQELMDTVATIKANLGHKNHIELLRTGPSVFAVKSRKTIKEEAQWLSILAIGLVITLLFVNYRSFTLIGLTVIPLASGLLVGTLIVTSVFGYVHGITLAFGTTLIGVAIDYPVHVLSHLTPQRSVFQILRSLWPVIGLGAFTTALGYCAMLFSGFPGLSQLGLFAIAGLLTSAFVTRLVLPSMIPTGLAVSPIGLPLISFIQRLPNMTVLILMIIMMATGYLLWSPKAFWEQNIASLSPLSQETKDRDTWMRKEVGAPAVRDLIVLTGPSEEEVLRKSEELIPQLEDQKHRGVITGYEMAAQYLPSIKTQHIRQALLPDSPLLRDRLEKAQKGLPFKQDIFEPFIHDIHTAKHQEPVNSLVFTGTSFSLKLNSLLFQQDQQWIGVIYLQGVTDRSQLSTLVKKQNDEDWYYLDLKHEAEHILTTYRDEVVRFLSFGAIAIILTLIIRLRSRPLVLRIVGSVATSVVTSLGLLHLFDERISLFHLSSLLLVIGIGLDYALFFHHHQQEPESRVRTIWAILICSTTTIMVFGLLAFSQTPVLHSIGLTAAIGALCCLIFSTLLSQPFSKERRTNS
ncbi:MAG: membrane protein [Nitrospirales bacterium]|nr:MAG: membrane protein [Nitrospirales bacterium]